MRAVIYVRVSSEEQAKDGYGLAAQREACARRAAELGTTVLREYADEGVTGAVLERPALQELLQDARRGLFDLLITLEPDRLARRLALQLLVTDELERHGVRIEFVNFEWKDTPEGRLFYSIRGAFSEYEREKIRARTMAGRRQRVVVDRKLPTKVEPYGYRYDGDGNLEIDPEEAEIVKHIFSWLTRDQLGPNLIAHRLNALGVRPKKSNRWHRVVVKQILQNPVYTGVFYAFKWDCSGSSLPKTSRERKAVRKRPAAQWVAIPCPAIIDREVFDRAQSILENARRLWAGWSREQYLLSGLCWCGVCGGRMYGRRTRNWGKVVRQYTCRQSWAGAKHTGCGHRVNAEKLEAAVWQAVWDLVHSAEELLRASDLGAVQEVSQRRQELQTRLEKLMRARETILHSLAAGLLDPGEASQALATNRTEQERVRKELDEFVARQVSVEAALAELRRVAERIGQDLQFEEKQALVRGVLRAVVVEERGRGARLHPRLQVPQLAEIPAQL